MWPSKSKKISFEDARKVLVTVLRDVHSNWAEGIASVSPSSFSSLLGGMGSFSDLVICRENQHDITVARTPLANELLSCLSEICFVASKSRELSLSAEEAITSLGVANLNLTGWRCLACGNGEVRAAGARSLIAAIQVREAIRKGTIDGSPTEALLSLWRAEEDADSFRKLIHKAQSSNISYNETDAWMRPCPRCGSDDTCVYRWKEDRGRFIPTEDNLPLRSGAQ